MNPAEAAAAYEAKTFKVTNVGAKERKGGVGSVGYVQLTSTSPKGTSKMMLLGEETLQNEYKVGEYYEMTLTQVKPPQD